MTVNSFSYDWWSTQYNNQSAPTPTPTPTPGPGVPNATPSQSALDILTNWFRTNLQLSNSADIVSIIHDAWLKGYTPADIDLFLPDIEKTASFQQRFPGYATAVKNGYLTGGIGGLSQYLQLEGQYRQIISSAGLPSGFYDDPSDFGEFIAGGKSPAEIESRVGMAVRTAQQIDPTMRNLMAKFYGLSTGDVAAYFLDPDRALPSIERQYKSAGVASWAARYGLDVSSMTRYESLVDSGISEDQAAQGYANVAALRDYVGRAGGVYGIRFDQGDAEKDVFFNDQTKRRKIIAAEEATFGGSSQGSTGSATRSSY